MSVLNLQIFPHPSFVLLVSILTLVKLRLSCSGDSHRIVDTCSHCYSALVLRVAVTESVH
jgi:hypothetical protein